MNKFKKYCPNVWVAECEEKYDKGAIIELETKHGKTVECEVFNLITQKSGKVFYSILRLEDQSYAQRRAERYANSAVKHNTKSAEYIKAADEGKEFLSLGEPVKVGHHSEKRHRALLDRNWKRMEKSAEHYKQAECAQYKAEYWDNKAQEITLAIPESIEYFSDQLEKAITYHKGLKAYKRLLNDGYLRLWRKKKEQSISYNK